MAAKRNINWSKRAINDLDIIYNYLLEEWTIKEANEFLDLVDEFVHLIKIYPEAFAVSFKNKNCRLGLIHKNITAVYMIRGNYIDIITLFDNRSNSQFR